MLEQRFDTHAVDNDLQRRDTNEFSFGQSAVDKSVVAIDAQQLDLAVSQPVVLIDDQDLARVANRGARHDDDVC